MDIASRNAHSVSHDAPVWCYAGWIPRYMELFALIRTIRNEIEGINVPCCAFQSKKDEMVAFSSIKYLKKNPNIKTYVLENSMHFYYDPSDYEFLKNTVKMLLN